MNATKVSTPAGLADGELQTVPTALRRREAANTPMVMVNSARFVTVELAGTITGLGVSAVRKRLERGLWIEGRHWRRAPDSRIYIDMKGIEKWVEGTE